nr:RDD family protein [Janibacter cremeus]
MARVHPRRGSVAGLADRAVPALIDFGLAALAFALPFGIGIGLVALGAPDGYACGPAGTDTCNVPDSGHPLVILVGALMFLVAMVSMVGFVLFNRVWRVVRTGASLGKKFADLRVVDAATGADPGLVQTCFRELILHAAGPLSLISLLLDPSGRSLGDVAGRTHVIHDVGRSGR